MYPSTLFLLSPLYYNNTNDMSCICIEYVHIHMHVHKCMGTHVDKSMHSHVCVEARADIKSLVWSLSTLFVSQLNPMISPADQLVPVVHLLSSGITGRLLRETLQVCEEVRVKTQFRLISSTWAV